MILGMRGDIALLVLPLVNMVFVLFFWGLRLAHDPPLQIPKVVIMLLPANLTMLTIPFDEVTTAWGANSNLAGVTVVNRYLVNANRRVQAMIILI